MIQSILIYYPTGNAFFEIGRFIIRDEVQTEIEVKSISVWFGVIRIRLSNNQVMVFSGLPYMITKG